MGEALASTGKKRTIVVGHSRESWQAEVILQSGKFDAEFYASQVGQEFTEREAIEHYVRTGEKAGYSPAPDFDVKFYRAINPDVADSDLGAFAHYLKIGAGEGRYPNKRSLKLHAMEVYELAPGRTPAGLWNMFSPNDDLADSLRLDTVEAHLAYNWRYGKRLLPQFDDIFYFKLYGYNRDLEMPPLIHYLRMGGSSNYFVNESELNVHREAIRPEFDEQFYESQGRLNEIISPLDEYCSIGWKLGRDPQRGFSSKFYLDMYEDIRSLQISPFYHFLTSGRKEGRLPRPMFENMVRSGRRSVDLEKKTVIVALHEASRTGAPLLGLEIGRQLAEEFNVVFILLKEGELTKDLEDAGSYIVDRQMNIVQLRYLLQYFARQFEIPFLIANSVETVEVAEAALPTDIATVALVHEFAEYTLPPGKIARMVMAADLVITPANVVAASAQNEVRRVGQFASNNIRVRQQGKLHQLGAGLMAAHSLQASDIRETIHAMDEGVKIVLGAGHVQTRKGVDTFVQTAHEVIKRFGDNVRFVWVGGGYKPESDINASVWIRAAVERLGLNRHVYFFPEQPNLDSFYAVADLFYLSSRLDPFPNVAIDVIAAGKKIVCFDQGTGVAEWISDGRLDGSVVEYWDISDAADAIVAQLQTETFSQKNYDAGTTLFSMEDYIKDLVRYGDEASKIHSQIIVDEQTIRDKKLMDGDFFAAAKPGIGPKDNAARWYSAWSRKGLAVWNPRPGFNEGKYRTKEGLIGKAANLLIHSSEGSAPKLETHICHILDELPATLLSLRVAVHLHLHYSDLASEFAERISRVLPKSDLFITTTTERARREIEYEFRDHPTQVQVSVVENRGRDIAPMLDVLREHQGRYDLFGHFHGKKSVFAGGNTGEVWRSFLLDTLAGSPDSVSKLLGIFERHPDVGLVFAEDRLSSGWAGNRDEANALRNRLGINVELDDYPIYPIGTMFWARTSALAPLIASPLMTKDFPPEPLPDDGTSLHALERIIPAIVKAAGSGWCTVRKNGVNRAI